MKNKKGFTLMELLAIIIIVAIVALIATPIVNSIIGSSKKSAFTRDIENVMDAIDWYILDEYDGKFSGYKKFSLGITGIIEIKGNDTILLENDIKLSGSGTIVVNQDNKYFVTYTDNDFCASKDFGDRKVKVTNGTCTGVVIPGN